MFAKIAHNGTVSGYQEWDIELTAKDEDAAMREFCEIRDRESIKAISDQPAWCVPGGYVKIHHGTLQPRQT